MFYFEIRNPMVLQWLGFTPITERPVVGMSLRMWIWCQWRRFFTLDSRGIG